ncbi:hypothetical protein ASPZODRAFT_61205 [Penicilliopsis zonata CBS 506.65]|uniref:Uncharacterized protein n=1 Tax=Penicilliopsis zonata CBS 506.65 TaxID=1073090 RepID=A0A1L9SPX1_9EURO|nr:hypothetical protein ASPZODRAFT_61205 [Penicilliopsis zonata CBS 506.65]OJJ49260.1 hypothetical protein ASPZODRAFT_61205 [Penicilliopsis zonata CBS 506.65]
MSPVNSLWFKWKSLRLPWRKSFLVGSDLAGNTFWEFKDALNSHRFRRIVKFDPKTHYGDVKVSPQWHQWLRYVRRDPPSIEEQQQDVLRQIQLKELARLADERWASKPSFLDKPQTPQPTLATRASDDTSSQLQKQRPEEEASIAKNLADGPVNAKGKKSVDKDPWAARQGGPSEKWQPEAWVPTTGRK